MIIRREEMLDQPAGFLLLRLSFPTMSGMMLSAFLCLIETYFVSRLGAAQLAAVTLVIPVQILVTALAAATGVGLTSLLSRTLGRGDTKGADNVAWHGLVLAVVLGVGIQWAGRSHLNELLLLFGCTNATFALSKSYLAVMLLGCAFSFISIILGSIIQGEGNTLLPMIISLAGIAINVGLDPLLIFGVGPVPPLGLNGVAWATIISQFITVLFSLRALVRPDSMLRWSVRNFRPSPGIIRAVFRVGLPALVMEMAGLLLMGFLNRILASYTFTAVAALGLFLRIRSMIYMPVFGLAQGAMPMAGFAFGARRLDRVKETLVKGSVWAFLLTGLCCVVIQLYPYRIIHIFTQDPVLTDIAANCLRLATPFVPLIGPLIILSVVLQALEQGVPAMWLSLFRQVFFFLPLLLILPRLAGLNGVWLSFSFSELMSAFLGLYYFIRLWRKLSPRPQLKLLRLPFGYLLHRLAMWLKW